MKTLREQQRGTGVPQVVNAHDRKLRRAQDLVKLTSDIAVVKRSPDAGRKHKTRLHHFAPAANFNFVCAARCRASAEMENSGKLTTRRLRSLFGSTNRSPSLVR